METPPGRLTSPRAARGGRRGQGDIGEDRAAGHILSRGWELLARGWTCRAGELDLVARHPDGMIVFLEVKRAFTARTGDPGERMTATKQRRVCKAATAWLVAHDALDREARFDLVLIHPDGRLEHLEDAFPYLE